MTKTAFIQEGPRFGRADKHILKIVIAANIDLKIMKSLLGLSFVYAAVLFGLLGWLNFITADDLQYSRLTQSLFAGQLHLIPNPDGSGADTALFNGYHYSALGPFPALLIAPLVWAGVYHQGLMSFGATLAVFYLCFRLALRFDFTIDDAGWLALAFCFGTSLVGVSALASSNHLAHLSAVALLFLAINEYVGQSRFLLIGLLIALAMASRAPTGLHIVFFILAIAVRGGPFKVQSVDLAKLLLSFGGIVLLLAFYNFARFGSFFEGGYSYQLNGYGTPYALWDVPGNTPGPALSIANIPNHLWIFLLGLPTVNGIGTSVILVSPFLVYLLKIRQWDLTNKLIVLDVVPVLLSVLAFRSTGFEQMGYRFSLDFLPFVFWLLMRSRVAITSTFKVLIFVSTVIDVFLTAFHMASGVDRRRG